MSNLGVSALFDNLSAGESTEMEWGNVNGGQCTVSDYEEGTIVGYQGLSLEECLEKVAQTKGGEGLMENLGSPETCEIPNFDPLFTAIYGIVPVIFGCSIALKVAKKIFSVD